MGDGNKLEEVVVCVQGIIADMDLPPISRYMSLNYILHCFTSHINLWNCRRVNPDKCRYIRQGITIIEPHCNTFADSLRTIIKVKALCSCLFKDGQLDIWAPSFIHSEPGISASNRYFQHALDTIPDDIVPLDENIDPSHILAAAAEDQFVHTINNCVEYYEHVKDDKGSQRYEPQIHL